MPNEKDCIKKEPLITLDSNGVSPIVKYSMPHETSYTAKAFIPIDIDNTCFNDSYQNIDNSQYYSQLMELTESQLVTYLLDNYLDFVKGNSQRNAVNKISDSKNHNRK